MGLLLDDRIWLWSIAAERFNAERRSGDTDRPGDIVLSSMLRAGLHDWSKSHWGQVVVFPPGTPQVHHKEMDSVPAMNPPGTLQIHFEFPTQFTSDDPSWDMHSTLTVFQLM